MKSLVTYLLIVVFSLGKQFASAQKIYFTDTTNTWEQFEARYNDYNPPILSYGTHYYISTVVIDSVQYRQFDFGFVREDTVSKKVFIRDMVNDTDMVLLNYNLNVGDTFTGYYDAYHQEYYKYVVTAVGSTMIDSIWYKTWHFSEPIAPNANNWWSDVIEGIGCIQHPTFQFMPGGVEPPDCRVYCFSNNNITPPLSPPVAHLDNTTSCITYPHLDVGILNLNNREVLLSPNPAMSTITISANQKMSHISVSNYCGQIIFGETCNTDKMEIDISKFPKGIYVVCIDAVAYRKFVKL